MLEVGRRHARRSGRQAKMIKAVRHLLLPQVAQVDETMDEVKIREAIETKEAPETLVTTRGDQVLRQAQIPRRASTPPAGRRRKIKKVKRKDGGCGTSWRG